MPKLVALLLLVVVAVGAAIAADVPGGAKGRKIKFTGEYYTLPQLTVPPKPEKRTAPRYPLEELRARHQGVARVAFIVNADGFTEELHLVDAAGKAFGKAALAAIEKWQFTPGEINGRRVRVVMVQDVPFTLSEQR